MIRSESLLPWIYSESRFNLTLNFYFSHPRHTDGIGGILDLTMKFLGYILQKSHISGILLFLLKLFVPSEDIKQYTIKEINHNELPDSEINKYFYNDLPALL